MSERIRNVSLHVSPPSRSLPVTEKAARVMPRPPLDALTNVGPRDLKVSVSRDRSPSAPPAACSDVLTSSSTTSPLEPVHRLQSCASPPSRRRWLSRRQSSISYLPPDSPLLWTPRTPQTAFDPHERSSPLTGGNNAKKGGHARACSIPQRAISEPAVLTLAERCATPFLFFSPRPFMELS